MRARGAGADDSKERFEAKLKNIAKAKPSQLQGKVMAMKEGHRLRRPSAF
jgi:hypothetical protein